MTIKTEDILSPIGGTRFAKLRPAQREAIELYAAGAENMRDIAIELPTGGGKTLIALLILDYWRKLGHPVAILTGNKTLAYQLQSEARDLNAPTVIFEGSGQDFSARQLREYKRAQAIAVMNYWVYINQKPKIESADYLVLDDAQLAEGALDSLYSLRVSRWEHKVLFERLMHLLSDLSASPVADDFAKQINSGPWGNIDLVHFSKMVEVWGELDALMEGSTQGLSQSDSEMINVQFQWRRIRANGRQALMFVDSDEITLRPYVYPTQDYPLLSSPKQRIYMSATLHDLGDLRRRLGTAQIHKLPISSANSSNEDGRKLFIFNQTTSPMTKADPSAEALVPLATLLNVTKKSVWLCSSRRELTKWKDWLQGVMDPVVPILDLTPMGNEMEVFCSASTGHLFIAGRFEGMDFPDDACRLAIFPSLPVATGALERFTTEQLKDARFQQLRMLERLKQGVGRCTRGNDDFAVYYFLDSRAALALESNEFGSLVSDRTRRQVEIGLELTEDGMGTVVPTVTRFLQGDFSVFDDRESKCMPPSNVYSADLPSRDVSSEIDGWRAFFNARDLHRASEEFEHTWREMQDAERELRAFWIYLQAHAEYLRLVLDADKQAKARCLNLLGQAVLEGGSASWFNRLRKSLNVLSGEPPPTPPSHDAILDRWDELASQHPHLKGRFLKWQGRIKGNLDGKHGQVCEALESLGGILGFNATRPHGDAFEDCRWATADHVITIEAKVNLDRDQIVPTDVNQADGHARGARNVLGFEERMTASIIVTPVAKIDSAAQRILGSVRIIRLDLIDELQRRLERIMRDYWRGWNRHDASARSSLRSAASMALPPRQWLLTAVKQSKGPFMDSAEFFGEWPREHV